MIVGFINSLFAGFGSGMVALWDTGIMLQNRRSWFLTQSEPCQPNCAA